MEIRPSIPAVDAPRPRLVVRVFDMVRRPDVKVESYRLRKALLADDKDAIVKSAKNLTGAERLAVLADVAEIRKGNAMPADTSRAVNWVDGFKARWSRWHPRPEQTAQAPAPARPSVTLAPQDATGFRHALSKGQIVHFDLEGTRHHAKILKWGSLGATVVTATGDIAAVTWADLKFGVAPEAMDEHVAKSVSLDLYAMTPEQRAAYFKLRDEDGEFTKSFMAAGIGEAADQAAQFVGEIADSVLGESVKTAADYGWSPSFDKSARDSVTLMHRKHRGHTLEISAGSWCHRNGDGGEIAGLRDELGEHLRNFHAR